MRDNLIRWTLFITLCLIWGSSFILMKLGMYDAVQQPVLSPYNVAALRMLSSGIVMLPFLPRAFKELPKGKAVYILLSGWIGSFFPAFLFCIAETRIDGALSGSLNALTPIFVIITGISFFKSKTDVQKIVGVIVGLSGCFLLVYANHSRPVGYVSFIGLVILATILYGINVNMVHHKIAQVRSIHIAAIAFTGLIPAALIVLLATGFFHLPLTEHRYIISTLSGCLLGVMGTAVASILFYMLVKRGGGLFASLVTYGIPFVAILWGIYYGETVTYLHLIALLIILSGVFITNKQRYKKLEAH